MAQTIGELKIKLGADVNDFEKGIDLAKQALDTMDKQSGITTKNVSKIIGDIADSIKLQSPQMTEAGSAAFGAIDDNVPYITEEILLSVPYIMDRVIGAFNGYNDNMAGVGSHLVHGIGAGIGKSRGYLLNEIRSLGQSVLNEIEDVFQIASPSKKTVYLGEMIGDGLAAGIAMSLGKVELSAGNLHLETSGQAPNLQSNYNTYNNTYNATGGVSTAVNLADFENRMRRAYA